MTLGPVRVMEGGVIVMTHVEEVMYNIVVLYQYYAKQKQLGAVKRCCKIINMSVKNKN